MNNVTSSTEYWEKVQEEDRLRELEISADLAKIQLEESTRWGMIERRIERVLVRSLRVICGLVLAGVALWAANAAIENLSTPFAAQSIAGVGAGIFLAWLAYWLVVWGWSSAFGPGPTRQDDENRQREKAAARIRERKRAAATRQQ